MKTRKPPNIQTTPLPDGWRYLVHYFDTIQEAFCYIPHEASVEELDDARQKAAEAAVDGSGLWGITWGAETLQVRATGATGGVRWVIGNDDFLILVKNRNNKWGVSVRYLSAGLYEHGYEALRERVNDLLDVHFERVEEDCERLSRIDMAVDIYCPGFKASASPRMAEHALLPPGCKVRTEGADGLLQTLTFGGKSSVEIQLYDKSREIREASGKEWFYDLWRRNGLPADATDDVWRLEIRFNGDWLKNRDIRTFKEYRATGGQLESEALITRRLCVPSATDSNRGRWPLHPIWSTAWEYAAHRWPEYTPIGRHVTGRRDKLKRALLQQIAGSMRIMQALSDPDTPEILDDFFVQQIAWEAYELAAADEKTPQKLAQGKERYRYVQEAR